MMHVNRFSRSRYWLDMEFRTRICQSESMPEGVHCFPGSTTPIMGEEERTARARQVIAGFATKFEPNLARTFLPGWDEPRFRSTFNISIRHFADARVLTNTAPLDNAQNHQTQPTASASSALSLVRTTNYATTPPMPLFLLAFAVGPFAPLEVRTNRGNVSLSVWCAPQDMLAAHFVANFSPVIFDRLQEDFGVGPVCSAAFWLSTHNGFLQRSSTRWAKWTSS